MLGSMKTRRAITVFHFWYQKMNFSFLFSYGSCFTPRSRTKRSAKTKTKIVCCFWLLQTTHMEEVKAGSTGPPVQLTPLSPIVFELPACENSAEFPAESGCKANDLTRYKVDTARRVLPFIIHPCDPTAGICYLIQVCDKASCLYHTPRIT